MSTQVEPVAVANEDAASGATSFQERLHAATPSVWVTTAMVVINCMVFVAMSVRGVGFFSPTAHQVLPWGANFGPLTEAGEWWRLLTACFLHFGLLHIAVNMYVLVQVGPFTERLYGNARYLALYLLAGMGGNLAGLFFHPFNVGAGASGAIFGVLGGLLAFLLTQRGVVPTKAARGIAQIAVIFIVYNIVAAMVRPETDQVAHLGGLLTGFLAGCLLATPLRTGAAQLRVGRALAVSMAFAAVGILAVHTLPKRNPAQVAWSRDILTNPMVDLGQNDRVVYNGTATREQATALGQALKKAELFAHPDIVVLLHRDANGAVLEVPLRSDRNAAPAADGKPVVAPWDNPGLVRPLVLMGPQFASAAGGPPLTIRLLNDTGVPQRSLTIGAGEVRVGSRDRVDYAGLATEQQAMDLGNALRGSGFFHDQGAVAILSRASQSEPAELSLVVAEDSWNNERTVAALAALVRSVAPAIGGLPMRLRLLDLHGVTAREVVVQ
jgi:rhomboid protease GluP